MNTVKWLLKREYWEHRGGLLWAPLVTAGIILLIMLGSMLFTVTVGQDSGIHVGGATLNLSEALANVTPGQRNEFATALAKTYPLLAMPVMITLGFVVFFYSLGSLYDDRKDRSILFWKSLPVSDERTVLSKAVTALLAAPILASAIALLVSLVTMLCFLVLAAAHGMNLFGAVLANRDFYLSIVMVVAMLPIYVLWALPSVGYLMFVSSWAKSKPFLWAVGVPVIGGVILSWINMLFGSPYDLEGYWQVAGRALLSPMPGSWLPYLENLVAQHDKPEVSIMILDSYRLLGTANLWIGVVAGLLFLFGAVKMRRYRDEG